jgi:hypothetical protein
MLNTLPATDNLVSLINSGVKRYRELHFIIIKIKDKRTSGVVCVKCILSKKNCFYLISRFASILIFAISEYLVDSIAMSSSAEYYVLLIYIYTSIHTYIYTFESCSMYSGDRTVTICFMACTLLIR